MENKSKRRWAQSCSILFANVSSLSRKAIALNEAEAALSTSPDVFAAVETHITDDKLRAFAARAFDAQASAWSPAALAPDGSGGTRGGAVISAKTSLAARPFGHTTGRRAISHYQDVAVVEMRIKHLNVIVGAVYARGGVSESLLAQIMTLTRCGLILFFANRRLERDAQLLRLRPRSQGPRAPRCVCCPQRKHHVHERGGRRWERD